MSRPHDSDLQPIWSLAMMSGTSGDGIDAALLLSDGDGITRLGPADTVPYAPALRERLGRILRRSGWKEPRLTHAKQRNRPGRVAHALTLAHVDAARRLLRRQPDTPPVIVGFPGQTIAHHPARGQPGLGYTIQLGVPELLSQELDMPVVWDFRGADVGAGGEGAPLAPCFHLALLRHLLPGQAEKIRFPVAIANLGGVANVTWIAASLREEDMMACDTGPGNSLCDVWMGQHFGISYDVDGAAASRGRAHHDIVANWLRDPFFSAPAPKSLDRNRFVSALADLAGMSGDDGMATLSKFTVAALAASRALFPESPASWLVTGGGRHNRFLLGEMRATMGVQVEPIEVIGGQGDVLEAQAFAYLAIRSLRNKPLSWPNTTGVARPMRGGIVVHSG